MLRTATGPLFTNSDFKRGACWKEGAQSPESSPYPIMDIFSNNRTYKSEVIMLEQRFCVYQLNDEFIFYLQGGLHGKMCNEQLLWYRTGRQDCAGFSHQERRTSREIQVRY